MGVRPPQAPLVEPLGARFSGYHGIRPFFQGVVRDLRKAPSKRNSRRAVTSGAHPEAAGSLRCVERGSRELEDLVSRPKEIATNASRLTLRLTPQGHLLLEVAEDAPALDDKAATRITEAFARGAGHGLMRLGAGEVGRALPPVFAWVARVRRALRGDTVLRRSTRRTVAERFLASSC